MSRNVILGVLACVALAVGCATKEAAERDQPGAGEPAPATVPDEASKSAPPDAGAATTTDALGTTGSAGTGAGPSSAAELGSATDAGTAVSGDASGTATTAAPTSGSADAGTTTRATADAGTTARTTADAGTTTRATPDAGTAARATPDAGTRASTSTSTGSGAPAATVAAPDKKTERLWKAKCAACHGSDGKGQTEQGRKMQISDMTQPKWQAARTDARLKKVILEGWDQTVGGVKQEMPGYKDELSPEQVDALVQYTRWVGQR